MSELLNPDDFVIVRKRKKYKFAKFHNAENCFEFDERRDFYQQRQPSISSLERVIQISCSRRLMLRLTVYKKALTSR